MGDNRGGIDWRGVDGSVGEEVVGERFYKGKSHIVKIYKNKAKLSRNFYVLKWDFLKKAVVMGIGL